jgi:hypothetical protein
MLIPTEPMSVGVHLESVNFSNHGTRGFGLRDTLESTGPLSLKL